MTSPTVRTPERPDGEEFSDEGPGLRLGHEWCAIYPLTLVAPTAPFLVFAVALAVPMLSRNLVAMTVAILVASLGGIAAVVAVGVTTDLSQPLFAVHRLAVTASGIGLLTTGCAAAWTGAIDPRTEERSSWAGAFVLLAIVAVAWVILDPHLQHVPEP